MRSLVIFYRDVFHSGGMPREIRQLARALKACQHSRLSVAVVGISGNTGDQDEVGDALPFKLSGMPGSIRFPYWGREFSRLLRDLACDAAVVVDNGIPESVIAAAILKRNRIPYIYAPGSHFSEYLRRGRKRYIKSVYDVVALRPVVMRAAAIRAYSTAHAAQIHGALRGDVPPIFHATEGIDWDDVAANVDNPARVTARAPLKPVPTFGFLGRLEPYTKGLDLLLDAWSIFTESGGSGILRFVGPPTVAFTSTLQQLSGDSQKTVEVLSPVHGADRFRALRELDVLVHPSRHEGVPRVLREGIAVGTPLLVSEQTNMADIVRRAGAGWVVDLSPTDIAQLMLHLCEEPRLIADAMGGTNRARRMLEWSVVADAFLQQFSHVREATQAS